MCRYLDLGSYAEWDEEKRIEFLTRELEGKRPLIPAAMPMTNDVREVSLPGGIFCPPRGGGDPVRDWGSTGSEQSRGVWGSAGLQVKRS